MFSIPVPVIDLDPVPLELKLLKFKLRVDIANVPSFTIKVVVPLYVCVASNVSVIPDPLTPIPFNGLLNWGDQVCVRVKTGANPVYVPPVANVNVSTFIIVVAGVLVVPVKFNALNQLPVVIVGILAPLVSDKFGALVAVPPAVLPKLNVLVTDIALVNPPVPV